MKTNNSVSDQLAVGIEIGGTKLQVGIGTTRGNLLKPVVRATVLQADGSQGILRDISSMVEDALISTECTFADIHKIGIGFGGPLDSARGVVLKSFQIEGWENFPLKEWAEEKWG